MKASDLYKRNLSQWAHEAVERYGGSWEAMAAQLSVRTGIKITGEQIRRWSKPGTKGPVKELPQDRLELIGYDKGMAAHEVNAWLRGESLSVKVHHVTRPQIQSIYDLEHLIEIQGWTSDQMRLVFEALNRCNYPNSVEELQDFLRHYPNDTTIRSQIARDRLQAIAGGETPTASEFGQLSQCFIPPGDASRLATLYPLQSKSQDSGKNGNLRSNKKPRA